MQHTQEALSMTSYTIAAAAIEYYTEALGQFQQLLGGSRTRRRNG